LCNLQQKKDVSAILLNGPTIYMYSYGIQIELKHILTLTLVTNWSK